jgi:hypothetical protein
VPDKYLFGVATERDVQQAKQILEQTRALTPQLETGIRQANNQLCILLGIPPRELSELEVGTYECELMPLKQLTGDRVLKIEKIVRDFTRTKEKPAENLPGLFDREKAPKFASKSAGLSGERDGMLPTGPALRMSKRLLPQTVAADLVSGQRPARRLLPQAGPAVVDAGALQPAGRLLPQTLPQLVSAPVLGQLHLRAPGSMPPGLADARSSNRETGRGAVW